MESEKDYVILRKTITTLSTSFILAYLLTITGLVQQLTDGEELSYHTGRYSKEMASQHEMAICLLPRHIRLN